MAREMKESGIAWIGQIPADWKLERLKWILAERKEKNDPQKTDFILSLGAAYGVIPYSEKEGGGNKAKETLTDYRLAYPNDIVMNSMNIISGSVGISKYFGCVSPVYYMLYPHDSDNSPEYYCYLFQTIAFQRSLLGLGNGILMKESSSGNFNTVRMRIPMEKLGVQLLPLPSSNEQHRIAAFLDSECTRIDAVIEQTRASIEEYKALKQSVIMQAVTMGLHSDYPMKNSGIAGVGNVRADWKVQSLKTVAVIQRGGSPRPIEQYISEDDTGYNWIRIGDSVKGSKYINSTLRKIIPDGLSKTRLISKGSLILSNSMSFGQPYILGIDGCIHDGWVAFSEISINKEYLYYFLLSQMAMVQFQQQVAGGVVLNLNVDKIGSTKIAIPDETEQEEIVRYLDEKIQEIDILVEKKDQLISELELYKRALIFEYVTGKKEVPA